MLKPSQRLSYLGFITDTIEMKYFPSEEKLDQLRSILQQAMSKILRNKAFSAKELASLLGKINALSKSHGNFVQMCRHTQNLLGIAVFVSDWETSLYLNELAYNEIKFVSDHLSFFNGTVINNAPGTGKLVPYSLLKASMLAVKNEEVIPDEILISDASDHSAFIFSKGKIQLIQDYTFSPAEQTFSSSHRELLALLKTFVNSS